MTALEVYKRAFAEQWGENYERARERAAWWELEEEETLP